MYVYIYIHAWCRLDCTERERFYITLQKQVMTCVHLSPLVTSWLQASAIQFLIMLPCAAPDIEGSAPDRQRCIRMRECLHHLSISFVRLDYYVHTVCMIVQRFICNTVVVAYTKCPFTCYIHKVSFCLVYYIWFVLSCSDLNLPSQTYTSFYAAWFEVQDIQLAYLQDSSPSILLLFIVIYYYLQDSSPSLPTSPPSDVGEAVSHATNQKWLFLLIGHHIWYYMKCNHIWYYVKWLVITLGHYSKFKESEKWRHVTYVRITCLQLLFVLRTCMHEYILTYMHT